MSKLSETRKAIRELDEKGFHAGIYAGDAMDQDWLCEGADLKELEAAYERLLEAAKMALSAPELKLTRDVLKDAVARSREDPPSAEARAARSAGELGESL